MSYIPASDSQYILNASGTTINPSTDETILLLRRMVQLLTPIATQDAQQRQRISLDASTATVNVSGTVTANPASGTITTVNNLALIAGVDPRYQFIDNARIAFASGIRNNLTY